MAANVLPDSVIVGLVLAGLQLLKSLVPQMSSWPNNAIRAVGFVGAYCAVIVNTMVAGPLTWQGAWGLLPLAGALAGSATLLYHLATDSVPGGTSAEAPVPADSQDQGRRLLAVPAEAQVSVLVPPRAAPSTSGAVPVAPPSFAAPTPTPTPPPAPATTGTDRVPAP